ncbi:MAG: methyltransferase domain-containing protein [Ardenticatenales bacterium]|nr:methyltransferase domain-containing protein [Ardenticatenales bacterium]
MMDDPGRTQPAPTFDADYYAHGCGRPYVRDDVWLAFFGRVADRIVADLAPRTSMDVGCAMGFLVEALRERGVDARGIDLSEYAIQQAHPDVAPFVAVASAADPLPGRYDVVTCIEVLEHMPPDAADRAIDAMTAAADNILFSSSPTDHVEPTHVNVQPPEAWAAAFARRGFYRDADFDATFLTPWAARFRKVDGPLVGVVAAYERRLWQLADANHQLREANAALRVVAADIERILADRDAELSTLRQVAAERDTARAATVAVRRDLDALRSTRTVRWSAAVGRWVGRWVARRRGH